MTIKVVRLRDYLDQRVHFLKLDIEGAESVVIPDIADESQNVDNLFIEYHSRDERQALDAIFRALADGGFRTYIESGPRLAVQLFVERGSHKGMDTLLNIFAVRS